MKDHRLKRWLREHREKSLNRKLAGTGIQVVDTPRDKAEGLRRAERADKLLGTPFVRLPGEPQQDQIQFTATDGTPVPTEAVEMVFNDMLLMDAIVGWGEYGPLYEARCEGRQLEVLQFARKAYDGVEIPEKLRRPA